MNRPPQEIIREKRDGGTLSDADIADFVAGLGDGRVTEGQAAAFAMAVYFRGLSRAERVALTLAMRDSGSVLAWDLPGPVLDKHSTGGVGDAVSLVLAPLVASCGGYVPKISGRGLGHTGGTLDKLASIPGYDTAPSLERLRTVVREAGCAVVGQTADLAPADKRLYAIRDVTATVESLDLITASILSKKLASGPDGLLLDVKTGSGAFMPGREDAHALARSLVEVANGAGCRSVALITDMDAPLASSVGNAVEVAYAVDYLTGRMREPRFHAIVLALATEMLALGGLSGGASEACGRLEATLADGSAAERFSRMVAALGGPGDLVDEPARHLPQAPVVRAVEPDAAGIVSGIASREIGLAVIGLGGGRTRPQDGIDHAVGFTRLARPGETVGHGQPLGFVHARDANGADKAAAALRAAYRIGGDAPDPAEAVVERIG